MKHVLFLIICLTFCSAKEVIGQEQDKYPLINLNSKNLKGKVRGIREKAYHVVIEDGKIHKGHQSKHRPFERNFLWLFYENGNLAIDVTYNWVNSFEQRIDYQYDSINGNLLGSYEHGFLFQGKWLHTYDAEGKLITTTMYDKEDSVLVISTHEYDENDNMVRSVGKGIAEYMTDDDEIITYDEQGNLLQKKKTTDRYLYLKNFKNGLIVEKKEFGGENKEELNEHEKYEYDKNGNEITIFNFDADGQLKSTQRMVYDEHNNRISKQFFNDKNELEVTWTAELIYDEFGNWTQKLISKEGNPVSILEREIEYYE